MRRFFLLLAALVLGAGLPAQLRAQVQANDSLFLRPGDQMRLMVFRQPDLSGDFMISPEGTIQHPLLTDVAVVGVTRSVLRERLRAALSRYDRDPAFTFDVLYRVAVAGEVRLPNVYSLPPQTTISAAVAAGGGVTEYGRLSEVHLLRDGQDLRLDLRRPDAATASMRIHSGDEIRVGRGTSLLRDVIGPLAAVLGAIGAGVNLLRR